MSAPFSAPLKKIDLKKQDNNIDRMSWVINEFLMNCGEQPIYNNYLDCMPEEILEIIYRFVNDDNIKLLSDIDEENGKKIYRCWGTDWRNFNSMGEVYHKHNNGRHYCFKIQYDLLGSMTPEIGEFGLVPKEYVKDDKVICYHHFSENEKRYMIDLNLRDVTINPYEIKQIIYGDENMTKKTYQHIDKYRNPQQINKLREKIGVVCLRGITFNLNSAQTYYRGRKNDRFCISIIYSSNDHYIFTEFEMDAKDVLKKNSKITKKYKQTKNEFYTSDKESWNIIHY